MPKLIRAILFVMATQQAQAIVVAAQVWSYQFTPTGSRPFESGCDMCNPDYLGTRADLAGTFSIVIDWETNTGMLGHVNDRLVNTATIVSSPPGTALVPNSPPDFDYGAVGTSMRHYKDVGTVTYSNGLGRLISKMGAPTDPLYEIWFTPTAATFSVHPWIDDGPMQVSGAFAAFTGSSIAGDFNYDGRADSRDYVQWRNSGGSRVDYKIWRFGFDAGASSAAGSAVPEPTSLLLLGGALAAILMRCRWMREKKSALTGLARLGRMLTPGLRPGLS